MGLRRMTGIGRRVRTAVVCAVLAASLSTCSTGLLDLLAFQVLADETGMLYLGYNEGAKGYGVARLGVTSGALEVLRLTTSEDNVNGCAVAMGTLPISADFPWPWLYFSAESPNRIMSTQYNALEPPKEEFQTGLTDQTNCIRVVLDSLGYPEVWWSAPYHAPAGVTKIRYTASFDVDQDTHRIYYLGLAFSAPYEQSFGVIGVNQDGTGELALVTIGHSVVSNVLLQNGYLYYVTQEPDAICRIMADGTETTPTTLLTPTAQPQAVAVDPADGTLYWLEASVNTPLRIMRAAPGETAGTPLRENLDKVDPDGFFFYRP